MYHDHIVENLLSIWLAYCQLKYYSKTIRIRRAVGSLQPSGIRPSSLGVVCREQWSRALRRNWCFFVHIKLNVTASLYYFIQSWLLIKKMLYISTSLLTYCWRVYMFETTNFSIYPFHLKKKTVMCWKNCDDERYYSLNSLMKLRKHV